MRPCEYAVSTCISRAGGRSRRSPSRRCSCCMAGSIAGETFQFLVDALQRDWPLGGARLARLRAQRVAAAGLLVPRLSWRSRCAAGSPLAAAPARLVGHSMGGNIACSYAGIRPERVRCVVNLEGFGLAADLADAGAGTYAQMAGSDRRRRTVAQGLCTRSSNWPASFAFAIRDSRRRKRRLWQRPGVRSMRTAACASPATRAITG